MCVCVYVRQRERKICESVRECVKWCNMYARNVFVCNHKPFEV